MAVPGIDLTRLIKTIRDQLQQSPLPMPSRFGVGTITINDGAHFEGGDIQMSPEALAAFKKLLGL